MNCCKTSPADTKPSFLHRHAGLLMCVAFLGLALFMYSRTDSTSGWTWLIALLCPAVHLLICHRMHEPAAKPRADAPGDPR